jgi:hypothetical protein
MASSISDFFSSAPPISRLRAPEEIQQPSDFASDVTITSNSASIGFSSATYEGVDWGRLLKYERCSRLSSRHPSWIYSWGWLLHNNEDDRDYWLCRLYHQGTRSDSPEGHVFV